MNRNEIKKIALKYMQKETTLICMQHPHDAHPTEIGVVPFHMNERGPDIPVKSIGGIPVLTFNGQRYRVCGYGPLESQKQRAIINPYADDIGDEIRL